MLLRQNFTLFSMSGILGWLFNTTLTDAVCTEEQNFKEDQNAHAIV